MNPARRRGPVWTPITPPTGFLFHAYPHPRPLTTAQQFLDLKAGPVTREGRGVLARRGLNWEFEARPTPVSRPYGLRLSYTGGSCVPDVVVGSPDLRLLAGDRKLPHVYAQSPPRLCLYLPGAGEWAPHKRLTQTVVPWAFLWLFYFEEWLVSDDWKGGGVHPPPRDDGD